MNGSAELSHRFSPAFSLAAGTNSNQILCTSNSLYQGLGVSLTGLISLARLRGDNPVNFGEMQFAPILPVFYSYCDKTVLKVSGRGIKKLAVYGTCSNTQTQATNPSPSSATSIINVFFDGDHDEVH